ncbi:C2H2-type zinc finger protein [Phanerochaete sordida]|uniref:C2H2-type zinc finger protein n=1 Tax=Phanerochaete sordida TaxID=48140 RepID=A0A9P3GLN3_9APHY|nr:C2H2-type zinc finger protein [Phanerochaete sordida]
MPPSQPPARVSLPSIHEMLPEYLIGLPPRREQRGPPVNPLVSPTPAPPHASHRPRPPLEAPPPPPAPSSPRSQSDTSNSTRRGNGSDEERRHACQTCGKAFNRPSSLAIHVNTHTGAKPFECPFPGCGRRFNVNSNMRRHLRNHTSPSRPLNTASPYTYPLTTVPRALYPLATHPPCAPLGAAGPHHAYARASDSGSEDDELSDGERWEHEHELAVGVDRLRLRAYSASSTASSPRAPPSSPPHRPRACSCAQPGCRDCGRATVLHPSSQVYRSRHGG